MGNSFLCFFDIIKATFFLALDDAHMVVGAEELVLVILAVMLDWF